jgi:hypothetical protein
MLRLSRLAKPCQRAFRPLLIVADPVASPAIHSSKQGSARSFSASPEIINDHQDVHRLPVTTFTEDEEMVRDAARLWANDILKPVVREMDNDSRTQVSCCAY